MVQAIKKQQKIKPRWETPLYKKLAIDSHIIDKEIYYTIDTCSQVLELSNETVRLYIKKGHIKGYLFPTKGDTWYINGGDLLSIFTPQEIK